MPSKKGKKPGKGSRGKVNIRCWFYEGKNISGCPTPDTCRYVHPWEPEWPTVASAQTVIRCNYFDHDGAPIGGGCPRGSSCRFLHPTDSGWRDAAPAYSSTSVKPSSPVSLPQPHLSSPPRRYIDKAAGRCRFFDSRGEAIDGGCSRGRECKFAHPTDPEWKHASSRDNRRVRCAFVGDHGEPLLGGCKAGAHCTFLHPGDAGWATAPRMYKTARCENYDDNGNPVRGGCPYRRTCTYIHPSDPEWNNISKRNKPERASDMQKSSYRGRGRSPSPRANGDRDGYQRRSPSFDRDSWTTRVVRGDSLSPDRRGRLRREETRRSPDPRERDRYRRDHLRERFRRSPSPRFRRRSPSPYYRRPRSPPGPSTPRSNYAYRRGRSRSPRPLERPGDKRNTSPGREEFAQHLNSNPGLEIAGFSVLKIQDDSYYGIIMEKLAYGEMMLQQAEKMLKANVTASEPMWKALGSIALLFPDAPALLNDPNKEYDPSDVGNQDVHKKAIEVKNYMESVQGAIEKYQTANRSKLAERTSQISNQRALDLQDRIQRITSSLNRIIRGTMESPITEASETETVRGDAMEIDAASASKTSVQSEASSSPLVGVSSLWTSLKNIFGLSS